MGRTKTRSPAATCSPARSCGWSEGLAEIEFDRGARVILQGPAGLELVSASSARLHYGTLTARVPAPGARIHRAYAARQGRRPRHRIRPVGR